MLRDGRSKRINIAAIGLSLLVYDDVLAIRHARELVAAKLAFTRKALRRLHSDIGNPWRTYALDV
jgi:hypothetical protein